MQGLRIEKFLVGSRSKLLLPLQHENSLELLHFRITWRDSRSEAYCDNNNLFIIVTNSLIRKVPFPSFLFEWSREEIPSTYTKVYLNLFRFSFFKELIIISIGVLFTSLLRDSEGENYKYIRATVTNCTEKKYL